MINQRRGRGTFEGETLADLAEESLLQRLDEVDAGIAQGQRRAPFDHLVRDRARPLDSASIGHSDWPRSSLDLSGFVIDRKSAGPKTLHPIISLSTFRRILFSRSSKNSVIQQG